jgi:uncharacterized protein (TIGR00251 family)
LVYVHLAPKAPADRLVGIVHGDLSIENRLAVQVRALPYKGQANRVLCSLIAKFFGLPKGNVAIASGTKSRHKTVLLAGDSGELAAQVERKSRRLRVGAGNDD